MKRLIISIFLVLFTLLPTVVSGQIVFPDIDEQVSFDISPPNPEPNETVSLTITSYLSNFDKGYLTWFLNGNRLAEGAGLRTISFQLGDSGETSTVSVVINKQEGGTLEKEYSITPADLNIIRQPLSYTPPFYKGKTLAARESEMLFVAIPNFYSSNGSKISSDNVIFEWQIDGTVDGKNSGIGRDTYYYEEDIIVRPVEVIVRATPFDSDLTSIEKKVFEYVDPSIKFYESHPSLGTLYNRTLSKEFQLNDEEIEITAIPYNFSIGPNSILDFSWSINNEPITISSGAINKLSLRRTDREAGSVKVELDITDTSKLLQTASSLFNINYNESSNF